AVFEDHGWRSRPFAAGLVDELDDRSIRRGAPRFAYIPPGGAVVHHPSHWQRDQILAGARSVFIALIGPAQVPMGCASWAQDQSPTPARSSADAAVRRAQMAVSVDSPNGHSVTVSTPAAA